jgi:exosortase/archaeosortase family protein
VPWPLVRAVGTFALIAGVWFIGLRVHFLEDHLWTPFTGLVARCSGWALMLFGADVQAAGTSLTVDGTSLGIAFGCNGLEAHGIFIAAVVASAMSGRRKLTGLVIGSVAIFIVNLIRVCALFIAAGIDYEVFTYLHTVVGQTFVIIVTMALFLWWDSRDDPKKRPKPATVSR